MRESRFRCLMRKPPTFLRLACWSEACVALRPRPFRSVANDHKSDCNADPVL